MKANELMINDLVYNAHNRKNEKVAEIGCGLVFWAVYVSEGTYALGCQSIDSSFANIRYVHQLQHALKLCGIKKEIIL